MGSRTLITGATMLSLILTGACNQSQEAPPEPIRLAALDLVLAEPPQEWTIDETGADVHLTPADGTADGILTLSIRTDFDTNLVAAVEDYRNEVEAAGDTYYGRQELVTQLGTAFTSRSVRTVDGLAVGETLIVALHPRQESIVYLTTRYPADAEPATRVRAAIEVFALIE